MITFTNDLCRDAIGGLPASRIMSSHLNTATWRRWQRLHQIHVDLWVMGPHKGLGNQGPTPQVLTNEVVDGLTILEAAKQGWKTVGLVIQRKHHLMHERKSGTASFS
jgi:hypothetical protein